MAERRSTIFLLLGMAAWIAAGFVGALIAAGIVGFGTGLLRALLPQDAIAWPDPLTYVLIGASGFQAILLLGALRQGRRAGDWRAGLGFRPIEQRRVVLLLSALILLWLMVLMLLLAAIPALRAFAKSVTPEALFGSGHDTVTVVVLRFVLVAILAPVSEELFFRGWLWEALRRRGQTIAMTALLTTLPWLLLHGVDSPGRVLVLIPAAVIFPFARHLSGSVRGSLAVHMTNNTAAVMIQTISALLEHGA